jgi:hypothetical protein
VVAVVAMVLGVTLINGYVEVRIREAMTTRIPVERSLSDAEREKIVTIFKNAAPFKDIKVAAIDTAEAASYGRQFMSAFREANQKVNGKNPDSLNFGGPSHARLFSTALRGLLIEVATRTEILPTSEPMRFANLLRDAGITVRLMGYENINEDQFILVVGPPP